MCCLAAVAWLATWLAPLNKVHLHCVPAAHRPLHPQPPMPPPTSLSSLPAAPVTLHLQVRKVINEFKVGAPARVGLVAPNDVTIPAGNTGMDPSQTSFFQVWPGAAAALP